MKVLVVDDSATMRKILMRAVRDCGFQVEFFEAAGGLEALEQLAKLEPALVLSDLGMPGMDGIELAHRMRDSGIPLIVFTAPTGMARAQDAIRAGAQDCLVNPFTAVQLRAKLSRYLG
jgi:CheY-like chemotaxis protein